MVKSVIDSVATIFVSAAYQVKNPTGNAIVTKYYPGGAFRVGDKLYYGLSDHLGSTSITIDPDGNKTEMRYTAWGEVRYTSGITPIDRTYTGQRSYVNDFGLMYYNARWYDSSLGRFAQADTVVPGGVQGYDRYAYVNNNPVNFNDPSGHKRECHDETQSGYTFQVCSGSDDLQPQPEDPQKPTRLTQPPGFRGSGQQMKGTYDRLASMCGQEGVWWCSSTQAFTIRDFMIMVLSGEFAPFVNPGTQSAALQKKLETAAANWFGESCQGHPGNPCTGPTPNAIFNWMGENLQSGQYFFTGNPTEKYPEVRQLTTSVVNAVLTVGSNPATGGTFGLVHWGNRSYYLDTYGVKPNSSYIVLGQDVPWDNPFYVIPYGEERNMICGSPFC